MRILITGIAGFIGFHTARFLKKRRYEVTGIDNFNTYYSPKLKRARQRELAQLDIEIIEADMATPSLFFDLFNKKPFTHILHLAAQAGVRYAEINPEAYLASNISGFVYLLEFLKTHPTIPLIFASSSSVYGLNEVLPFSENHSTDKPSSLYAATKKAGETIAFSYHHNYGIPMTALRFFTVYGPWGRPDMAYWTFCDAIREEKPIFLFNSGHMERDFTYIDDILPALEATLHLKSPHFEIFNLGNHRPESITTFIALLEKGLNKKAIIQEGGEKRSEVARTYADITLAQKKLNFSPKTSLEDGINHFISWYNIKTI